ncbi:MAG TPA: hypothetical protein VN939_20960 [Chthoniobacterales bacterium]|jgi:hypothetical protein|nr:hypothetical protein [Chthoniobacterales bacterium]
MSCLVTVTFDLHGVPKENSEEVYQEVYADLSKIGLARTAAPDSGGAASLPESTVMGKFSGKSAEKVGDKVHSDVKEILKATNRKYIGTVAVYLPERVDRRYGIFFFESRYRRILK